MAVETQIFYPAQGGKPSNERGKRKDFGAEMEEILAGFIVTWWPLTKITG